MAEIAAMDSRLAAAMGSASEVRDAGTPDETLQTAFDELRDAATQSRHAALAEADRLSRAGAELLRQAFALARSVEHSYTLRLPHLRLAEAAYVELRSPVSGESLAALRDGRVSWRQDPRAAAYADAHGTVGPTVKLLDGELRFRRRWGLPTGAGRTYESRETEEVWK